jgi:hypothetical protein
MFIFNFASAGSHDDIKGVQKRKFTLRENPFKAKFTL